MIGLLPMMQNFHA